MVASTWGRVRRCRCCATGPSFLIVRRTVPRGRHAEYGFFGVPAFFIISGFVIAYSSHGAICHRLRHCSLQPHLPDVLCLHHRDVAELAVPWAYPLRHLADAVVANLFIAAPAFGHPYMDGAYWSLVIEVAFYIWVTVLMAANLFPCRLDAIVRVWICITFANELTLDAPIFEKLFLADDSGFSAVGLMLYELYRGQRDLRLYAILALSVGTAAFQPLHKLVRLAPHTGGAFDHLVEISICLASVAIIYLATPVRRLPLPEGVTLAIGGLTYPLYLLHMQLGYTVLGALGMTTSETAIVSVIVVIVALAWAIWRFVERPLQKWTKVATTRLAAKRGLSVVASVSPAHVAGESIR